MRRNFKLLAHSVSVVDGSVEWSKPEASELDQEVDLGCVPVMCGLYNSHMEILAYHKVQQVQQQGTQSASAATP